MRKVLADGRIATVDPLTFGRARINVCQPEDEGVFYEDNW